jgi:hypothetical protein
MSKPRKTRVAPQSKPPLVIPTDPATLPARYILITEGACLEPDIPSGSKVVIERDGKIAAGDLAVLYFKPEHILPGKPNSMLKRVVLPPPSHTPGGSTRRPRRTRWSLSRRPIRPGSSSSSARICSPSTSASGQLRGDHEQPTTTLRTLFDPGGLCRGSFGNCDVWEHNASDICFSAGRK